MIVSCWIIPCDSQLCLQNVYAYQKPDTASWSLPCLFLLVSVKHWLVCLCLFCFLSLGLFFSLFRLSPLPSLISPLVCSSCVVTLCVALSVVSLSFQLFIPRCNSPHNLLLLLLVLDFFLWIFLCWFLFRLICSFLNHQPPFLFFDPTDELL